MTKRLDNLALLCGVDIPGKKLSNKLWALEKE
jgi:hypothetical protein